VESVEDFLSMTALARFLNSPPVLNEHPDIAFGIRQVWRNLQSQLAVLEELAEEKELAKPEEVVAVKHAGRGRGNLKDVGRRLKAWWRSRRSR
jgi:hypothetical protein